MALKLGADSLERLMQQPSHIRNICILAHVDHGKTTLSDCLISSNNIISQKLAGRVRYMDSTEEEQARGITMKSSSIALLHQDEPYRELRVGSPTAAAGGKATIPYLINLIDSPGHVDFSMDVATAARLCDGALVIVDAIEGVCIQTHAVLRVAWAEGVRPALVINKVDRLITEVKMSPMEAYHQINKILEQCNVIMSELYTAELMSKLQAPPPKAASETEPVAAERVLEVSEATETAAENASTLYKFDAWGIDIDEEAESQLFFDPTRGNVIFASAYDGWAFTVDDFAALHHTKLEVSRATLRRGLWGDYYYQPKTKKIVTGGSAAAANKGKPLAVSLMLEKLWAMYEAGVVYPDEARLTKIVGLLGLEVNKRDLASKDLQLRIQAIMRAWLPLHAAVLGMVVRKLPSPVEAQQKRLEKLWPSIIGSVALGYSKPTSSSPASSVSHTEVTEAISLQERLQAVRNSVAACDTSPDAECVVFVSKMFVVPKASLPSPDVPAPVAAVPEPRAWWGMDASKIGRLGSKLDTRSITSKRRRETDAVDPGALEDLSDIETFIAFARVFSGVLRPDRPIFVLGPRYDPFDPAANTCDNISLVTHGLSLYLMMGREISPIAVATAGNVIGIGKLGGHVLKTATMCTTPVCASMSPMTFQTTPLVKVAVEPKDPRDFGAVERGLTLLNQADPCVEVTMTDSGEMQLSALGELHLDRCITDLTTRFARVDVKVSPPIMNFMETITVAPLPQPATATTEIESPLSPTGPAGSIGSIAAYPKTCAAPYTGVHFHVPSGTVVGYTSDRSISLKLRALPAPPELTTFVYEHAVALRALVSRQTDSGAVLQTDQDALYRLLKEKFTAAGGFWASSFDNLICLGPKGIGPNFLFDNTKGITNGTGEFITTATMPSLWVTCGCEPHTNKEENAPTGWLSAVRSSIVQGFQLATGAGPLCAEPMWAVAFVLEEISVAHVSSSPIHDVQATLPPVPSGQLITTARDSCRTAFQAGTPRLVEAYFKCELQCSGGRGGGTSGEQLGKLYAVLSRRRARILSEDMLEGTQNFVITALLPVVESFGFADDLRKKTSGAATSPQLVFSHWEVLEQDPFFQPTTAAEKEEFGDTVYEGQLKNIARRYMDAVRERKGMPVEKQLVAHAEKQSTMSRKK